MFAQLPEQEGVDAGDLLALAGHVLRVHLPRRNTPPIFSSKLYVLLKGDYCKQVLFLYWSRWT